MKAIEAIEVINEIEEQLSESFSVEIKSLLEFILLVNMSVKNIKGNQFRTNCIDNLINSEFYDDLIEQNQLTVRQHEYDSEHYQEIGRILMDAGYFVSKWVYMDEREDDRDGMYFFDMDDEVDVEWVEECIKEKEKSVLAFEKYESQCSSEYQRERGRIVSPWTGRENYDPLYSFFAILEWTDKLPQNDNYVKVHNEHMLNAFLELSPKELVEKVNLRAKEIAIQERNEK